MAEFRLSSKLVKADLLPAAAEEEKFDDRTRNDRKQRAGTNLSFFTHLRPRMTIPRSESKPSRPLPTSTAVGPMSGHASVSVRSARGLWPVGFCTHNSRRLFQVNTCRSVAPLAVKGGVGGWGGGGGVGGGGGGGWVGGGGGWVGGGVGGWRGWGAGGGGGGGRCLAFKEFVVWLCPRTSYTNSNPPPCCGLRTRGGRSRQLN